MQRLLNNIARVYPIIPGNLNEDGIFGPLTQASVIAFQNFFGLVPDGVIGPITWARIVDVNASMPNVTAPRFTGNLQNGSRGDNVRQLQENLNALVPFYPTITRLNVDGIFGAITQGSVMAFQRAFGMSANGVANQVTWNLIMSMRNLLAPPIARAAMLELESPIEMDSEVVATVAAAAAVVESSAPVADIQMTEMTAMPMATKIQPMEFYSHVDFEPEPEMETQSVFTQQNQNSYDKLALVLALILLLD